MKKTNLQASQHKVDFIGSPACFLLDDYADYIISAFHPDFMCPYLVGSSLIKRNWRDVDVRLILTDEEYEKWELGDPQYQSQNARWRSFCLAYSVLGKQMTGLPIDFQIQQMTRANIQFKHGLRQPIGISYRR